ncbi:hypothetical protein B0H17DRAFT_1096473 [Mycena rosella]|uniref:Uncharacterized protein n=1 Tax=Mycena rosella TaxID=1033263 RepID=A0AAD7G5V5_MYCRO|nr:hypothetical protein B0H17DRAFT_1096473 [Mycena rosella]
MRLCIAFLPFFVSSFHQTTHSCLPSRHLAADKHLRRAPPADSPSISVHPRRREGRRVESGEESEEIQRFALSSLPSVYLAPAYHYCMHFLCITYPCSLPIYPP